MKNIISMGLTTVSLMFAAAVDAKTASEVFDLTSSSIVVVRTYNEKGKVKGLGSGVVLGDEEVVTNCHVLKDAAGIQVVYKKIEYPAIRLHSDPERDVCSLSVSRFKAPAAVKGSSGELKVGAKIYVIGSPRGLELTLSEGIISNLRPVAGKKYLQITAPISPGSSGGGLFDEEGLLVGLPAFYLNKGQQLNFALPVEWINELPDRADKAVTVNHASSFDWVNSAVSLEKKKEWKELLNHGLRWTKAQSRDEEAWLNLGRSYRRFKQYPEAIAAFQKAVEIDAENAQAWHELGDAFNSSGKYPDAINSYQKFLQIKPDSPGGWCDLGTVYGRSGQKEREVEAYRQALRIDPEYKLAWYNLGITFNQAKDFSSAIEEFQKAIKLDPAFYQAWTDLGVAYHKTGDELKAIDAFQQALRSNPDYERAWNGLGVSYSNLKQFSKSVEAFKQSLRLKKDDKAVLFNLGAVYKYAGQSGEVMTVYKRLKTLDPELAEKFFKKYVVP